MWVETRAFTRVLPRVWVQPPQMVLGKFCINHFVPSLADLPGPLQFATRGLYMSADVRVLLFPWLNVMYSSICILFFPLLSLIHFSKCLPRRLNKCLGRWGKVNLGQTASRWTEGWVECVKVNCGPFSLITASHQTQPMPARSGPASSAISQRGSRTAFDAAGMMSVMANKACNGVKRSHVLHSEHETHRQGRRYWVSYLKNVKGGLWFHSFL